MRTPAHNSATETIKSTAASIKPYHRCVRHSFRAGKKEHISKLENATSSRRTMTAAT